MQEVVDLQLTVCSLGAVTMAWSVVVWFKLPDDM